MIAAALLAVASLSAPPTNEWPDAAHAATSGPVLVVSGRVSTLPSPLSMTESGPSTREQIQPGRAVLYGALLSNGPSILVSTDGQTLWLSDGDIAVVDPVSGGGTQYKRTCICRCGTGWVSMGQASPCSQFNGGTSGPPCIDPTNQAIVPSGLSDCQPGVGPS